MSARPTYTPAHRLPAWLSSEDVKAAIARVVEARGEDAKAVAWDLLQEINLMVDAPQHREATDG